MSATWSDIQAVKNKQNSLRESLARKKRQRLEAINDAVEFSGGNLQDTSSTGDYIATPEDSKDTKDFKAKVARLSYDFTESDRHKVEAALISQLLDISLPMPLFSTELTGLVSKSVGLTDIGDIIDDLLLKFSTQQLVLFSKHCEEDGSSRLRLDHVDHSKLSALKEFDTGTDSHIESNTDVKNIKVSVQTTSKDDQVEASKSEESIENLLACRSTKERESNKMSQEIQRLLLTATSKEKLLKEKFHSQGGSQVKEFCSFGTKDECTLSNTGPNPCDKLHFVKIIKKHTDESLGDCSFLNTCFHMDTCKYVHYEVEAVQTTAKSKNDIGNDSVLKSSAEITSTLFPAQWIQCDLRNFNMSVLGKFAVIMADPPWDIHMELPYGTMSDDEMRKLSVPVLQDNGFIFLWVTGSYNRVEELIWVKTNQLQRIIRTGRTGHWLNHGKEHCLVGAKGNLSNVNKGLDCDVIVAEVRATSHKPDEIYGIIERLSPGTRKIELFGRPHNVQPNWVTLGNQLDGVMLLDPDVVRAFRKVYPDMKCM